jgi:hypothetical protein
MDPITALATISAIWGGIKKTVEIGREVQDVMGQLSQWAQAADVLEQAAQSEPKKPPLFKKLNFGDDTKQAFDAYTAKVKIREMEAEIRHEFLYGGLNHLGMDGLKEFYNLRRQIRERRIKMLQDQKVRRQKFIEMSLYGVLIAVALGFAGLLVWTLIALIVK